MAQHVSKPELKRGNRPGVRKLTGRMVSYACGGVVSLAALMSCSPESRPNPMPPVEMSRMNRPPLIRSAQMTPVPLVLGGPISVEIDAEDADGDFLQYEYRWWVNDHILRDVTASSMTTDLVKTGDKVMVELVAFDGKDRSASFKTEPVVIQNSRPVVTRINLETESPTGGATRLKANVAGIDHDGDDVHYVYRWWRNDVLIKEGREDTIDTVGFARKDSIVVEVTPWDQDGPGAPYRSIPAVVGNASPRILSKPGAPNHHAHYEYTVQADDPDGDSLQYALEIAPPGMAIDTVSGLISWTVSSELAGTHRVKVSVNDGQGGVAWQEFDISIPTTAEPSSGRSPHT
jgi:hypothetical protein